MNVAVIKVLVVIFNVHVGVPVHAPDHPANTEPVPGVAVSVTGVPLANVALHAVPQLMPDGLLVTVPVPVPLLCSVS